MKRNPITLIRKLGASRQAPSTPHLLTKSALLMASSILLSGCAYIRALSFEEHPRSGITEEQKTTVYLIGSGGGRGLAGLPQELVAPVQQQCAAPSTEPAPAALGAAIIGFFVQYGIDLVVDELASRVDALVARGTKVYSANAIVSAKAFDDATCIVLVREAVAKPAPAQALGASDPFGLALILRKKLPRENDGSTPYSDEASVLVPIYLKMYNAVAITGQGEPVDLSVAVTAKAAFEKEKVRKVDPFGTTTFTIPGIELGPDDQSAHGKASGLFPQAPTHASAVELAVAVTESGSGVPDAVKARAELEALKAALGPILVEKAKALAE